MKSGYSVFSHVIQITLLIFVLSSSSDVAQAKAVYDPFIQEFQVGVHSDPDKVELAWGYPSRLLEPASIDTSWTAAGLRILNQEPSSQSPHLSLRLLNAMGDDSAAADWITWHRLRIEQLTSSPYKLSAAGRYLLAERLTMGFFSAVKEKNYSEARRLAGLMAVPGPKLKLAGREVFVWELRRRMLDRILHKKVDPGNIFWKSSLSLGTWDLSNAWVLWTAHHRLNGYPALPATIKSRNDARALSVLRKSWLSRKNIQNSAFSHDTKAGLGSRLLKKQELNEHLLLYPDPPSDFMLQGWWVSGQRSSRRGESGFYEDLARRTDLKPGWRMDLFRRASEIHLLAGRWEKGIEDLSLSLDEAQQNAGSAGQRRRLRQWTEQAMVLALANEDTLKARQIYKLGLEKLAGEQNAVFKTETRNWSSELGLEDPRNSGDSSFRDKLRSQVEKGNSKNLEPMPEARQKEFQLAATTPLWKLWARWGLALTDPDKNQDSLEYCMILDKILETDSLELQKTLVIEAVSGPLKSKLDQEILLRWVLDKDIHHNSGGRSLTAMTPIPGLARKIKGDSASLHALLGIALLADDLRGIVGVATPMPQTGLTKQEKLCFLYPLPGSGSIHEALTTSNCDAALLLAVARNESLFEPSVRSRAGALGWMQIMPFHFPDKGARPGADNWSCAAVSIAKGDALLAENRRRYQGNPYLSLAAYNAGPGAVKRWQKQLGGNTRNDIFLAWIGYPETRHYVEKVLIDKGIYDWIISESRLK